MISFQHNGHQARTDAPPLTPLVDVLRDDLGDTSPKPGCREGRCGACTVLLDDEPVLSCLVPVARVAEARITTAQGLGQPSRLSPLQAVFAETGAVQCGICTPGMLMAASALVRDHPHLTREEVAAGLANNLCRCTGYAKILDAVCEYAAGTHQPDGHAGPVAPAGRESHGYPERADG